MYIHSDRLFLSLGSLWSCYHLFFYYLFCLSGDFRRPLTITFSSYSLPSLVKVDEFVDSLPASADAFLP